jgi:phosphoribosylaminoimidazolecarboxamide formyltransferase/IMP cyclohydrolase
VCRYAVIRAAAKNHPFVYCLVDAADYAPLIAHLKGSPTEEEDMAMRKMLAWKAYQHCASYDSVVSEYLWSEIGEGKPAPELSVPMTLMDNLRYGENPHQPAAVYADSRLSEASGAGVVGLCTRRTQL